jgi:hypothetical protein
MKVNPDLIITMRKIHFRESVHANEQIIQPIHARLQYRMRILEGHTFRSDDPITIHCHYTTQIKKEDATMEKQVPLRI